jgi:hypothetical protein
MAMSSAWSGSLPLTDTHAAPLAGVDEVQGHSAPRGIPAGTSRRKGLLGARFEAGSDSVGRSPISFLRGTRIADNIHVAQ